MVDKLMSWLVAYIELGLKFVFAHLMTIEGMIALFFGIFFIGLVSRLRS